MNNHIKKEITLLLILLGSILALFIIGFTLYSLIKPDYHGVIRSIDGTKLTVSPIKMDPEVDYIFPEFHFNQDTNIVENGHKLSELANNQEVKIWVEMKNEKEVATKIKIINK
ncbi:hypothetical protein SAMN05877753_103134 [Bacillus oleivorans]|uniref:Uncharacterized protein n=1 Tax=Bacillus oleivorans TaxID=1448271 RepID=A0A285CPV9_9BACI|nr:hypothetical protein [Bacillus oleivorans]SNX69599.1 hypothetical protein SAMN05877753_103134 [Bacillus oleivorans]